MPWIHFAKKNRVSIEVASGALLMKSLLEAGLPVASSCQGKGVCSKCRVRVSEGNNNLRTLDETEAFLLEKNNCDKDQRISCQVEVYGDVTVDTGYW